MRCLLIVGVVLLSVMGAVAGKQAGSGARASKMPPPLFLTPLLQSGNATAARFLASNPALMPKCCKSYSGLLTVDAARGSNMFFWFFRAENNRKGAPLVVWLQGGPGTSLMRAVFQENGPYWIASRTKELKRRRNSWTRNHAVLYFDNPIGTGFSFARTAAGYARTLADVSAALYEALRQFFMLFPAQRARPLYIAGESFGGKMATGLAHLIHTKNADKTKPKMNLQGVIVVNALLEAENQLDKSELAYQMGLVDERGRDEMRALAAEQARMIRAGRWNDAMDLARDECGGPLSPAETGYPAVTDLRLWNGTQDDEFTSFVEHRHVRHALHVGNLTFTPRSGKVSKAIWNDVGTSALPLLADLADHYRVLVVGGQMDVCLPYRLTANLARKMSWGGAEAFRDAPRTTWCVQGQLAGYARATRNLTLVMVRNAGHYLGQDQPAASADLLDKFTAGLSFSTCFDSPAHDMQ